MNFLICCERNKWLAEYYEPGRVARFWFPAT
jgi:hypothetical protein